VSTDDQAKKGFSLAAQKSRIKAYAQAHDYELVSIKSDNGVSGKVLPMKRPGLREALELVRGGEADGLLFLKLDRLSRSVRDILDIADDANRGGWHIMAVHENIDTSSATGRFTLGVLAGLAQMEREQISERTIEGMNQILREGRPRSRILPFGYRIEGESKATTVKVGDKRPIEVHEPEMKILKTMMRLRKEKIGAHRTAKTLNSKGVLNPRIKKPWTTSTVASILRTVDRRELIDGLPRWLRDG